MSDFPELDPSIPKVSPEGAELRPHAYDGIMEYDNPVPRWMQALLGVTVLFSLVYIPYYLNANANGTSNPQAWLAEEMKAAGDVPGAPSAGGNPAGGEAPGAAPQVAAVVRTEEMLQTIVADPAAIAAGKTQYATSCASCHGPEGQGLIGPNLTDNAWIHGGKLTDIRNVIDKGVLEKGMLAWGTMLKPETLDQLVAYVVSIKGTNPPNPKAPQGEVVP